MRRKVENIYVFCKRMKAFANSSEIYLLKRLKMYKFTKRLEARVLEI